MTELLAISSADSSADTSRDDPYAWIGKVLTNFAIAEQAIGSLCAKLGLPISNGRWQVLQICATGWTNLRIGNAAFSTSASSAGKPTARFDIC